MRAVAHQGPLDNGFEIVVTGEGHTMDAISLRGLEDPELFKADVSQKFSAKHGIL